MPLTLWSGWIQNFGPQIFVSYLYNKGNIICPNWLGRGGVSVIIKEKKKIDLAPVPPPCDVNNICSSVLYVFNSTSSVLCMIFDIISVPTGLEDDVWR